MKRIIVVGHAALDRIYRIAAFPKEPVKVRALEHIEAGGGMAANAASAIARLGAKVELWSRVGDDAAGDRILELLEAAGVDISHVRICHGGRSSTSAVIVDGHGERFVVGERDHAMPGEASWLPLSRLADAGAVLSDLRWFEATRAAFAAAREIGVPTLIDGDLGAGEHLADFVRLSDYAILSAAAFASFRPEHDERARLDALLALGPRHAGVTRGANGYKWANRDGERGLQPAYKVDVVDTTGAGDAFHGAFTWAVAQGLSDAECARVAAATAALKCRRLGARAGLPTRDELEAFLASVETRARAE